jgi:DNA polymerase
MTAGEKTTLAALLDTAADYLGGGYAREREAYNFEDDGETAPGGAAPAESISALAAQVSVCTACGLGQTRTKAVPGEGAEHPLVMVIGEGPGADEDASGRPFVGKAGQLLDRMLGSVGLYRDKNCFIANVVKCRPPQNRDPEPEESAACAPFLEQQIRLLKPKILLCAGRVSSRFILKSEEGIGRLRGRFSEYPAQRNIPVLPTYHPSAILRDDSLRRPAFEDLKLLMVKLLSLDPAYAAEVRPLLAGYAEKDEVFAAKVKEYLA